MCTIEIKAIARNVNVKEVASACTIAILGEKWLTLGAQTNRKKYVENATHS